MEQQFEELFGKQGDHDDDAGVLQEDGSGPAAKAGILADQRKVAQQDGPPEGVRPILGAARARPALGQEERGGRDCAVQDIDAFENGAFSHHLH